MARANENPFGPGLMKFLRELQDNNQREWFDENKARYEQEVREPALELIRAMAPGLEKISPHLAAVDRKVGGSLMRIYRDVRFSKDKSPYKTNLGIQFRHVRGKDVHAPGYYFHIDSTSVFLGAGMWRPESEALAAIRREISERGAAWKRVRDDKRFRQALSLAGDSLKRPPRGYSKDDPMLEDLLRKDCIAVCDLKKKDITRPDLIPFLLKTFGRAKRYMAWQANAIDLPF